MLPLMATEREIQSQWNRYGSCSGLDQQQYFESVERARRKLEIPQVYDAPERRIESSHDEVLQTFSAINPDVRDSRSEEHTSELQSLMRNSYAVFCLKTKTRPTQKPQHHHDHTPHIGR